MQPVFNSPRGFHINRKVCYKFYQTKQYLLPLQNFPKFSSVVITCEIYRFQLEKKKKLIFLQTNAKYLKNIYSYCYMTNYIKAESFSPLRRHLQEKSKLYLTLFCSITAHRDHLLCHCPARTNIPQHGQGSASS